MKKLSMLLMVFVTILSFSFKTEIVLKAGIDVYRANSFNSKNALSSGGFVVGVEALPISLLDDILRIGVGTEYNFGYNHYAFKNNNNNNNNNNDSREMFIPAYAILKASFRPGDNTKSIYAFTRLGYAYGNEVNNGKINNHSHGVYFGLGAGFEVYKFIGEIVYDGKYVPKEDRNKVLSKIGLRLGYIFGGDFTEYNKPQINN